MGFILSIVVNACAVAVTAYLMQPSVQINSFYTAFVVAVVLGFINTFVKPVVTLLTLPFNLLTLGLLSLVINGIFILFVSRLIDGFHVTGLFAAVIFSIILSLVSTVLGFFVKS